MIVERKIVPWLSDPSGFSMKVRHTIVCSYSVPEISVSDHAESLTGRGCVRGDNEHRSTGGEREVEGSSGDRLKIQGGTGHEGVGEEGQPVPEVSLDSPGAQASTP